MSSSRHAVLVGFCLAAGCTKPAPDVPKPKPPEVVVDRPTIQNVTDTEDFPGRTEAVASVDLKSRVTGYLLGPLPVRDGVDVDAGTTLFQIDPKPYQAELDRTTAGVSQAQAHLVRTRKDFDRVQTLREKGATTPEEIDRAAGDREEADAAVAVANAARQSARLNLDFTKIAAPLAGRFGRRSVDPGNLIKADDTLLGQVVQLDPMYVNFDVDDRTVLRIRRLVREGKVESARKLTTTVAVGLPDKDTYDLAGKVDFVESKLDPGTGTLRLRAVIDNKNLLLSPGLFVRVRLPVGVEHPAVVVPESAIGTDQGERFVYVVKPDDTVEARPVKLGGQVGTKRVVLPRDPVEGAAPRVTGVTPADRIIVDGLQRARPGGKVTVRGVGS